MTETTLDDDGETPAAPLEPGAPTTGGGMGPARLASIVVGILVLALVVLFAIGRDTDGSGSSPLLGTRVPAVTGEVLGGGGTYDIDDHRGSWVLVNFFGTWCPPCVAEHPELVALQEWGAERGDVELVSVVFNDDPALVQAFFDERGGDWPVIDNPTVPVAFQVAQIPETFLVSPAGQVVSHIQGQTTAAEVQALIEGAG